MSKSGGHVTSPCPDLIAATCHYNYIQPNIFKNTTKPLIEVKWFFCSHRHFVFRGLSAIMSKILLENFYLWFFTAFRLVLERKSSYALRPSLKCPQATKTWMKSFSLWYRPWRKIYIMRNKKPDNISFDVTIWSVSTKSTKKIISVYDIQYIKKIPFLTPPKMWTL